MAEMTLDTALDLAKSYHAKQVLPFARLAEVLEVARDAERRALEADKRKGEAEAAVIRAQDRLAELQTREVAAFNEFKAANDTERKRLASELLHQNNELTVRLAEIEAERVRANKEHSAFIEKLVREREAAVEEDRRARDRAKADLATAEKAYEAFKKKVGMA